MRWRGAGTVVHHPAADVATATPPPRPGRTGGRTGSRREGDSSLEHAARQAGILAGASSEVSETSQQAAASLGELRLAIGDISDSAARAATVAEEAVREARAVDEGISSLDDASAAIADMVRTISAISQQSRFLALNAFVEAARAGEAGRGFTVVADEVKQLAERTARTAEDISARIGAVQDETRRAVAAIGRIGGTLGSIAEAQDAIAAAVEQQRAAVERVAAGVDRAADGSRRISEAVAELAETQRVGFVSRALSVAQQALEDAGGAELGPGRSVLSVRDQATDATRTVELPDFLVGGVPLDRNDDPRRPSPFVDGVVDRVGGSCTLFQRLDRDGSMVRAATTVRTQAGRRNVGTFLARSGPDGSPNPVLTEVLAGGTYTGPAMVAGRPHFTAYTGIHSAEGELIGMLYVGLPLDAMGA